MTKKYIAIFSFILVVCLALGFAGMNKGPKDDPTSNKAPFVNIQNNVNIQHGNTQSDNVMALWTESFDGATFPPTGWTLIQESGTCSWARVTAGTYPVCAPHSGAALASFRSWYVSTGTASLVSSVFSLTAGAGKLGFWMMRDAGYSANADLVNFLINTAPNSTGATLLGTINRSKALAPVETGPDGWYYYEFAIPAGFNTATNYIILQGTSAYGNDCYVDDVAVSLLLTNDVGTYTIDITSPSGVGAISPKATVKNFGTTSQTFPVTMTINPGGYTNQQTVTALGSGLTQQVTFSNWTAAVGSYTVRVYTQLTNDLDRTNDTLNKSVTITNAVNGSWNARTPLSLGIAGGVGACYIPSIGKIFLAGGSDASVYTNCYLYDPATNAYTPKASLPLGRGYGKVVKVKDSLYYVNSIIAAFTTGDGAIYKYDWTADTWVTKTPQPTAIQEGAVVVWRDSLIITVGGSTSGFSAPVNNVRVYNPRTDTWTELTSTIPTAAMGYAGECIGNEIFIVGGVTTGPAISNLCYRGTIIPGSPISIYWRAITNPYGEGVYRAATGIKGNNVFLGPTQKGATPPFGKLYSFSMTDSTIGTYLPDLAPPLGNITALPLYSTTDSTFIYTFGGYDGAASSANVWMYKYKSLVVGTSTQTSEVPSNYLLSQNYPNPFNPVTKISYALPKSGFISLKVYDMLGKEVATLVNEQKTAGTYSVDFNASQFSSGVYFYKIVTNGFSDIKRMVLIK